MTWRLHGSLPASFLTDLEARGAQSPGEHFRVAGRQLDRALFGPLWLKDSRIAACIVQTLRRGEEDLKQYALYVFVVMANHAHVLLQPKLSLARITNGIKGVTARQANQILGRTEKRFWQDESFDHWVRNASEFERIHSYIERNPVVAGLARNPADWPWSSPTR